MVENVVKVFLPSSLAFFVGILIAPFLTHYLYKYKMWKKKSGKMLRDGKEAEVFNALHKDKDTGTPRMGGIIIWTSTIIVAFIIWCLGQYTDGVFSKLDFISRDQTWIPFVTLLFGAVIGLVDDLLEIKGSTTSGVGGLSLKKRLAFVGVLGLVWGYWFYAKLGVDAIGLPFGNMLHIGWLVIPLFALVMIGLYSGGIIDGLDGLAGGVFATIFTAYAGIAFAQSQINLAAFCATLSGSILAFLWFNIPPARFYMTETGSMALTMTLAVVAFMTDTLADKANPAVRGGYGLIILPIIAFPLIVTSGSNILQGLSKRFLKKKIFHIAPIHHHFEALGWPSYKVTMRYWIVGIITALIGMVLALIG